MDADRNEAFPGALDCNSVNTCWGSTQRPLAFELLCLAFVKMSISKWQDLAFHCQVLKVKSPDTFLETLAIMPMEGSNLWEHIQWQRLPITMET